MAKKPIRAIVCEGKDDLAVIRAMLLARGAKKLDSPAASRTQQRFETDHLILSLESRDGKSELAKMVLDATQGTSSERPDRVMVSFDPDLDPPARELAFFEKAFEDLRRRRAGPLQHDDRGRLCFRVNDRDVLIFPAAWRSSAQGFAGLPEEHNIERLLVEGILASRPTPDPMSTWVDDTTTALMALVKDKGYKRALRIWSAALAPDSESFAARLLEMHETKHTCLGVLEASPAGGALDAIVEMP